MTVGEAKAAIDKAGRYKLIELLLICVISAPASIFLYPRLCTLSSCGPVEAFAGMMFGYGFCSLITGYFFVTGAAFHLTSRWSGLRQILAMAGFSGVYGVVSMTLLNPGFGGLLWIAATSLALAASGSAALTRRTFRNEALTA